MSSQLFSKWIYSLNGGSLNSKFTISGNLRRIPTMVIYNHGNAPKFIEEKKYPPEEKPTCANNIETKENMKLFNY